MDQPNQFIELFDHIVTRTFDFIFLLVIITLSTLINLFKLIFPVLYIWLTVVWLIESFWIGIGLCVPILLVFIYIMYDITTSTEEE